MFTAAIAQGAGRMGLVLTDHQCRLLDQFVHLLAKWNRVYNLTAVRDPGAMVAHHILDSLSVLPYVMPNRIIDVGTGAGLPGIPLAIVCPGNQFVLLDGNRKKIRFVAQAKLELGLSNTEPMAARVEAYAVPHGGFDTVTARALARIDEILALAGHLCRPGGRFVLQKGVYPGDELSSLPSGFALHSVEPVEVPGIDAPRHVVVITKDAAVHAEHD